MNSKFQWKNYPCKILKINPLYLFIMLTLVMLSCEKEYDDARLVINEVYTFADETDKSNLDFIEIYNHSIYEKDLSGLILWESGGREEHWKIPDGSIVEPNSFFVIECDKDLIDPVNFAPWGLSKGPDEYIVLADSSFVVMDSIKLPTMKRDESYGRKTDAGDTWVIFSERTKNASNNGKPERQLVTNTIGLTVNEVYSNDQKNPVNAWANVDWIELHNSSNVDIDLTGYKLEEDSGDPSKAYIIPAGFVVQAKGFKVFDVNKNNTPAQGPSFGLGKSGDWVFLTDPSGKLISEIIVPSFEDAEEFSAGRKPDGSSTIVTFTVPTKGTSNNNAPTKP